MVPGGIVFHMRDSCFSLLYVAIATMTAVCITHNEVRIDNLIVNAIEDGFNTFDDIFLYVGRRYSLSNSTGFFSVVERRFKALKRDGAIAYDRAAKTWLTKVEQ